MQNNAPAKGGANPHPAILQPQWVPMGLYVLINKGTNMLLDLRGGNRASGSPCEGWPRNFNEKIDHQFWVISHNQADGSHKIMSYRAGTFLHLESGKHERVVAFNRVGDGDSNHHQQWKISGQLGAKYYTIECLGSHKFLEIAHSKTANGAPVTCSPQAHDDHQLWEVLKVSCTHQCIRGLIQSWKPELVKHLVRPFADDVQYFVLPDKLRDSIYDATQLLNQPVRKGTFDHGDFAIKVKDAVKTWARDRSPTDGYSVLFGIIYGEASKGPNAYNWYLSSNMKSLVFFDPQANKEYKSADLDSFGFKPSCAVF